MRMKKIHLIFLSLIFVLGSFGCAGQEKAPVGNTVFTDEFFSDVVEIKDMACGHLIGEQMKPVMEYLKGLTLTPTDIRISTVNENGEVLFGPSVLTFVKSDGTEVVFVRNHAVLSNRADGCNYVVAEGENLNAGLREASGN